MKERSPLRVDGEQEDEVEADTEALLSNDRGEKWAAEILEAVRARKQAEEVLKRHPRPTPPRGMMQRRPSSIPSKVPSTMHNTLTDTKDKH